MNRYGRREKRNHQDTRVSDGDQEPFTLKNNWLRNKDEWNYTLTENDVYAISNNITDAANASGKSWSP